MVRRKRTPSQPAPVQAVEYCLQLNDALSVHGRARRFAELSADPRCLAAPVRDHSETVVASLGTAGPGARLDPVRVPDLIEHATAASEAASQNLGFKLTDVSPGPRGVALEMEGS